MTQTHPQYPGTPAVIHGNGAVAHVMKHVCGGVIGYPITPATEISELFEAFRAEGGVNVWGQHPFFFEPEGEHSAQSGALGAALTGGHYISNASSSQGVLYAMESHYVTVGKKVGGFVLQVAARVVSRHSLNVMAGHDDVYALLSAGYTILFGSNPQEAADLAAIAYRTSALSLIPVANAMDGFATSHMLSEADLPEPALLRDYLGDPASRIPCPTVAQEILFGARGRVFQLRRWIERHRDDLMPADRTALTEHLTENADKVEADAAGVLVADTLRWMPEPLHGPWRRQWVNSLAKGTRQLVPALVDVHNPGLTGPVQNQPDFQAGAVDHRTRFADAVPSLARQAMAQYAELTGRAYAPVLTYDCEDAEYVMVGLGSITDDVRAVLPHLRAQGIKAGVVSVKLLQPFPEAELVAALGSAKAVTVLERSDQTALTGLVSQALFRARANADSDTEQFPGIPALSHTPRMTTAIFGLGGHDVQAVGHVRDGDTVVLPIGAGEAPALLAELSDRRLDLHGVTVFQLLPLVRAGYFDPGTTDHVRHSTAFLGGTSRAGAAAGWIDYCPAHFSEIPELLRRGLLPCDVVFARASAMDEHGYFSLGLSADDTMAAIARARAVVLEVNPQVPFCYGDCHVHVSQVTALVERTDPIVELPHPPLGPVELGIGRFVAELIPDGATLQIGIGAIPDAVVQQLGEKNDLGVHTEMFGDGILALIDAGVVTNDRKNLHPGKMMATFALGSAHLYEYMHRNPALEIHPVDVTNDPLLAGQNNGLHSINGTLAVDLIGQCGSETLGHLPYSGTGGQVDFVRAANRSRGGKAIIVVPSTARGGTVSRIVATLAPGTHVTTGKNDVDYVVTEYGVAQLRGKCARDRARALIDIAHPDFREQLADDLVRLRAVAA